MWGRSGGPPHCVYDAVVYGHTNTGPDALEMVKLFVGCGVETDAWVLWWAAQNPGPDALSIVKLLSPRLANLSRDAPSLCSGYSPAGDADRLRARDSR